MSFARLFFRSHFGRKRKLMERKFDMPAGNGTGPDGMGPMTGRALGYCAGYDRPGYMNDGFGRGGGRGFGRGFGRGGGRGFGRGFGRGGGRGFGRGFGRGYGRGYAPASAPAPGYAAEPAPAPAPGYAAEPAPAPPIVDVPPVAADQPIDGELAELRDQVKELSKTVLELKKALDKE